MLPGRRLRAQTALLLPHVEGDGEEDDAADDDLLGVGVDAEEDDAVVEDADDGGTEDGALAAEQTGAADDGSGDDRELEAETGGGLGGDETGDEDQTGQRGEGRAEGVNEEFDEGDPDPGQTGGLFVAADGV